MNGKTPLTRALIEEKLSRGKKLTKAELDFHLQNSSTPAPSKTPPKKK